MRPSTTTTYTLTCTGAGGSTTKSVVVNVGSDVLSCAGPGPHYANPGETAILTTQCSGGSTPYTYQWQFSAASASSGFSGHRGCVREYALANRGRGE